MIFFPAGRAAHDRAGYGLSGVPVLCTALIFFCAGAAAQEQAQNQSIENYLPGMRDRALVLDIVARVVERNQEAAWNEASSRVTIPGRAVGIRLVGSNIVITVTFTPYLRASGPNILVAQGQIWLNIPGQGISFHSSIETIPLEFGENVYFFPLGRGNAGGESRIEIQVAMRPYGGQEPFASGGASPAE